MAIITKSKPYTKEEIEKLKELFDVYIKTVIDVREKVCSAGADRHFDNEQIMLQGGSKQENLWGGGIDLETMSIDCYSMINIRPSQSNPSRSVEDPKVRERISHIVNKLIPD